MSPAPMTAIRTYTGADDPPRPAAAGVAVADGLSDGETAGADGRDGLVDSADTRTTRDGVVKYSPSGPIVIPTTPWPGWRKISSRLTLRRSDDKTSRCTTSLSYVPKKRLPR